jgi:WD40 repeat protein/DNA-binding SARP family transcriptional activator
LLATGGPKQRTLLVHLILQANRVVTVDRLIDALWGDESPEAARNVVQTYVHHLRSVLGAERIGHRAAGYMLAVEPGEIDALRFEELVRQARRLVATDSSAALAAFDESLRLWAGPPLDDLADQASLQPDIVRLDALRLAAIEERATAALDLGRHAELVPELENLVALNPLRERLWAQLMLALYRSGRQGDALAAFVRARRLLVEELGVDPSRDLQDLHRRMLDQDPALEVVGLPLRGYLVLEQVGVGAFGAVHRALQPQVGREVAVKVIHSRLANDPGFIRRFEAEAQLIARLEHPHIVPLYDYWREPDRAYLVMRYLRGGNLRDRLANRALTADEAARLVEQMALALSAAHRRGVVHRDVKPANVLFDEEGNAYLSDFGIARDLAAAEVAGPARPPSPLAYYMSPEEIKGEPVTPRTDVYGLGFLLFEALAARHPFADTPPEGVLDRHRRDLLPSLNSIRRDLPGGLDEIIARATAKSPAERYAETTALSADLRATLTPAAHAISAPLTVERNPYKGLRPFLEPDADDYFGREALVAEIVERLAEDGPAARFLAVVGPSGSGKSSVVRAGLIPGLRAGALPGSAGWFVLEMHPGAHPFEELQAALLRIAVDPPSEPAERMRADDSGLVRLAAEVLPQGSELVLIIDQFEEIFTLVADEQVRSAFLRLLQATVTHPRSHVRVVVTVRADFYDRPLSYGGLAELVKARTVSVTPLTAEELERAVMGPAARVGLEIDPALLARIVADVASQPGGLPLLQFALAELFDHRQGSALDLRAYREIGGVLGALAQRAEELYGRQTATGREATRQLFLRLVTLGEEGSDDTRRRVSRSELTSLEVDREAVEGAIDALGARRLLSFDRDPLTRGPTVEVAHEALLHEWARLRGWIEAAREDLRTHRRLAAAASEWVAAGGDPAYLLRGGQLARFEGWAATSGLALTDDERVYLQASMAQRDADRVDEESRAARERGLERRSLVRLRALVAVLAGAALVAAILTLVAFEQRQAAEGKARVATAGELAAAAIANLDVDPERSILLALEAVDATRASDGLVVREAEEALHRAVKTSRIVRTFGQGGSGLAVSPDGKWFAAAGSGGDQPATALFSLETGEQRLALTGIQPINLVASADGALLGATHADGAVRFWDVASGDEIGVLQVGERLAGRPAISPDGGGLAVGAEDGTVRLWEVETGQQTMALTGHTADIFDVAFSPDGSRLASSSLDTTARVWDLVTGSSVTLAGHLWAVQQAAFNPDGSQIATAAWDSTARIWDVQSGTERVICYARSPLNAVAFSPDGRRIATGGSDGTARLWDAATCRELLTLPGHDAGISGVAFTPGGDHLLTVGFDDTTRLWDISVGGARDWLTLPGAERITARVAFAPDGRYLAAPAQPTGVSIWDVATGEQVTMLTGHPAKLASVAFSPDGRRLAATSDLTTSPSIWDVESGELLFRLVGHPENAVRTVAFTPDGSRLITGGYDATWRVWDSVTGAQVRLLLAAQAESAAVDFSRDGRLMATADFDGNLRLWDAASLELLSTRQVDPEVEAIAFGPAAMLVTAGSAGTAQVWDLESEREPLILRGHRTGINWVAVSPDGTRIATAGGDRTARLWDATTGRELLTLFGHELPIWGVAFSPDGRLLATSSADGMVALHLLPIDELVEFARGRVTRELTDEECRQYLRLDGCPAD